jgi:hypothetical protein
LSETRERTDVAKTDEEVQMSAIESLFLPERHLLVLKVRGLIDAATLNKVYALVEEHEQLATLPFDRFCDALEAEEAEVNFRCIFQLCLYRRRAIPRMPPVKSAIVVPSIARAHYAQLHALMMKDSPIDCRLFEERVAAARFLEVPVELTELRKNRRQA